MNIHAPFLNGETIDAKLYRASKGRNYSVGKLK
jgi:hypothetical protein